MIIAPDAAPARKPAEVFGPGDFLREELEARGWTQLDLADILGRPPRVVNEVITGKRGISPDTAKGLAAALGTSPEFWMRLDATYQLWKGRDEDTSLIRRRARIYGYAPVRDMLRRGWLEPSADLDRLEHQLCAFFGVRSLDEEPASLAAARKSTSYAAPATSAQRAWLWCARQLANGVQAAPYAADQFDEVLQRLRVLRRIPDDLGRVPWLLAEAGIRLVIVEPLPGTRLDGGCFWADDRPVIALSLRFNRIDNVWFVLLHELGHVRRGDALAVDADLDGTTADRARRPRAEEQADTFAADQLVPPERLKAFVASARPGGYTADAIEAFADAVGVHPGIVVGQLQHRGEIAWAQFRRLLAPIREVLTSSAITDGWGRRGLVVPGGGTDDSR